MDFNELKTKFKNYLIIDNKTINLSKNPSYLRRQISEWKRKKWLIELKRGMYVINDNYFLERISKSYVANQIYSPSYISLEYAMAEYELIPEMVKVITSVTTRKTAYFKNNLGDFTYRSIKRNLFFGYKEVNIGGVAILFATKEKAFLDFIYLNLSLFEESIDDFYKFRFQNLNSLKLKVLNDYIYKYKNKKLERVIKILKEYIKKEKYKVL